MREHTEIKRRIESMGVPMMFEFTAFLPSDWSEEKRREFSDMMIKEAREWAEEMERQHMKEMAK